MYAAVMDNTITAVFLCLSMNVYAHATREAKKKSAKLLDMIVGQ